MRPHLFGAVVVDEDITPGTTVNRGGSVLDEIHACLASYPQ